MSQPTLVDLYELEVKRVMSSPTITIASSTIVAEAIKLMLDKDIESLVVVNDKGKVVGILTFRDLVIKCLLPEKKADSTLVSEVMSEEVVTCTPDTKLIDLMRLMKKRRLRRLPVVDAEGKPVGFVSNFDLALVGLNLGV